MYSCVQLASRKKCHRHKCTITCVVLHPSRTPPSYHYLPLRAWPDVMVSRTKPYFMNVHVHVKGGGDYVYLQEQCNMQLTYICYYVCSWWSPEVHPQTITCCIVTNWIRDQSRHLSKEIITVSHRTKVWALTHDVRLLVVLTDKMARCKCTCSVEDGDAGPSKKSCKQVPKATFEKWQQEHEREHQTLAWLRCEL